MPILDLSRPYQTLPNRGRSVIEAVTAKSGNLAAGAQSLDIGAAYAGGVIVAIDPEQGYRVRMPDGKERYVPASVNPRLEPYLKADGSLDIVAAVKAGVTDIVDYGGWNISSDDLKSVENYVKSSAIQDRLSPYKLESGSYDLYKAIQGGASKADLQEAFNLSDEDYQAYVLTAPYITYDRSGSPTLDIERALDDLNGRNTIFGKAGSVDLSKLKAKLGGKFAGKIDAEKLKARPEYARLKTMLSDIATRLQLSTEDRERLITRFGQYKLSDADMARLEALAEMARSRAKAAGIDPSMLDLKGLKLTGTASKADLAAALERQFGIKLDNRTGEYKIRATGSSEEPIEPKGLPDGYTAEDVARLQAQLKANTAAQLDLSDKLKDAEARLKAFRERLYSKGNGYTTTNEETAEYEALQEEVAALAVQLKVLMQQSDAAGNVDAYFKAYDKGWVSDFKLTTDDYNKFIEQLDVDKIKYITSSGGFDLIRARKDGMSDEDLKKLGFDEGAISYADAWIAVNKILPDGLTSYTAISLAKQAGLDKELATLGVTDADLYTASAIQTLIDRGYVGTNGEISDDALLRAKRDGLDAYLLEWGFTHDQLKAAQLTIDVLDNVDKYKVEGGYDLARYLRDNPDKGVETLELVGFTADDIKSAQTFNAALNALDPYQRDGSYDIAAVLRERPDDGKRILETAGFTAEDIAMAQAFNKAVETIEPYKAEDGYDIAKVLRDRPGDGAAILKFMGYTAEDIAIAQAFNKAVDTVAPYKNEDGYDLPAFLKARPDDGKRILETAGFAAEDIAGAADFNRIETAIQPYIKGEGYWLEQYLRDNPKTGKADLKTFGYDDETINAAAKVAELSPNYDDYTRFYLVGKGVSEKDAEAIIAGKMPATFENQAKYNKLLSDATAAYTARYGTKALEGSIAGKVAPYVFQPARALAPDVTLKDIGGLEWASGVAQLALLAVPVAKLPVQAAVGVGAAAIFAAQQAKEWKHMTGGQKALSVAGDLFVMLPALGYAGSKIRYAKITMPTTKGKVTIYRGLAFNEKPILGKAGYGQKLTQTEKPQYFYRGIPRGAKSERPSITFYSDNKIDAKGFGKGKGGQYQTVVIKPKNPLIITNLMEDPIEKLGLKFKDVHTGKYKFGTRQYDEMLAKAAKKRGYDAIIFRSTQKGQFLGGENPPSWWKTDKYGTLKQNANEWIGVLDDSIVEVISPNSLVNPKTTPYKGGLIIGNDTSKIAFPSKAELVTGYKPLSQLETEIIANREALRKIGFTDDEILRMESTLINTKSFAGKKSPSLSKTAEPEPVRTLSKEGVAAVLKHSFKGKNKGYMRQIYGSLTMKQQLAKAFRSWRELGDIDVMTTFTKDEAAEYAKELVKLLEQTEGVGKVRVNAKRPMLIETMDNNGKWDHAVDIHTFDEPIIDDLATATAKMTPEQAAASRGAGEGAYGMTFYDDFVTINYEGIGKVKFMSLSESGKRKMASILEWNVESPGYAQAQSLTDDIAAKYGLKSTKASRIHDELLAKQGATGQYKASSNLGKAADAEIGLLDLPKYAQELDVKHVNTIVHELVHHNFDDLVGSNKAIMSQLDDIAIRNKDAAGIIKRNFEELSAINITKKLTGIDNQGYHKALMDELRAVAGGQAADEVLKLASTVPDQVKLPPPVKAGEVVKDMIAKANKDIKLTFAPPAHRIKDISDFYVILRTFKGKDIADDWAKIYGYDTGDLLAAQERDPLKLSRWVIKPDQAVSAPSSKSAFSRSKGLPIVTLAPPKNLPHARASSPAAIARINKAVSSPSVLAKGSPAAIAKLKASLTSGSSPQAATKPSSKGVPSSKAAPSSTGIKPSPKVKAKAAKPSSASVKPTSKPASKPISKPLSPVKASSPISPKPAAKFKPSSKGVTSKSKPPRSPGSKYAGGSPTLKTTGYSPALPSPKPSPKPERKNTTKPPSYPPGYPPPPYPKEDKPVKKKSGADGDDNRLREGDFAWRQGLFWIRYRPIGNGRFRIDYSRKPFEGAIHTKRTPTETFYVRGSKDTLPAVLKKQMGVVNVDILPSGMPQLKYRPNKRRRK